MKIDKKISVFGSPVEAKKEITIEWINELIGFYESKRLPLNGDILLLSPDTIVGDTVKKYAESKGLRIVVDNRPKHESVLGVKFL